MSYRYLRQNSNGTVVDPDLRARFMAHTEAHVKFVSQMPVRGTWMVNSVFLHCFQNDVPLPLLNQHFFIACFLYCKEEYVQAGNEKLATSITTNVLLLALSVS